MSEHAQTSEASLSAPQARRSVSFGPASVDNPSTRSSQPETLSPVSASDSLPKKARISDSMAQVVPSSSPMTPSSSSTGTLPNGSALKPALKAGSQSKRLPPPNQYQHPDPLLRRLRLVDDRGSPIDLKSFFRGVRVVAFYFGSQWAGQPLKEYHKTINEMALEHPNELRVIYVSVDVDEQWYKAGVKGQPWVSMVWNDGSSLPSPNVTNATSPSAPLNNNGSHDDAPPLYNHEDFLLAQEVDIDESLAKTDTSGEAYLRPFSRVHLASKLNILAAPTVCIYHLDKQKMLDRNVRMARLHSHRRDETWGRWKRGETAKSLGISDALHESPIVVILLVFAVVYWSFILIGGQDYNFLRKVLEKVDPTQRQPSFGKQIKESFDRVEF